MFNLFRLPHKCLKKIPVCKFNTHSSLKTWNLTEASSVQHRESLLMHVLRGVIIHKSMSQSEFYIFQKRGYFSPFLLSAAACSQRLVVSVWWCNGLTVLLQSSRKASATAFRSTAASDKDTYTTPAAVWAPLAHWGDVSWSQGRWTETSRISYEI